jgi:Domain of unknown function (DUF4157)
MSMRREQPGTVEAPAPAGPSRRTSHAADAAEVPLFLGRPVEVAESSLREGKAATEGSPAVPDAALHLSRSGDPMEVAADAAADDVMQGARAEIDVPVGAREPADSGAARLVPDSGKALDAATRAFMEPRFNASMASVRIHDDAQAAQNARRLSARAYTIGEHVVFGAGQYRPDRLTGRRLIAHELAHVMQARAGASAAVQRKEDWDFTPADYAQLRKGKGELKIAADSSFVPSKLQDNILATLRYALDVKRKPAATAGVNLYDFYHGHLAVPNDDKGLSVDAIEARSKFKKEFKRQTEKSLGDEYAKVTTKNLKAYTKAIGSTLPLLGTAMEEGAKIKGAAVMYHTYETTAAGLGIDPQDPRRNILTPLDTNKPRPYKVPKGKSDWTDAYINYLEFTFLVDQNGEVHVRPGTIAPLSTVIGEPAPNQ